MMKICIICGQPVPKNKRRDARYCGKARCRKIAERRRKRLLKPRARALADIQFIGEALTDAERAAEARQVLQALKAEIEQQLEQLEE